MPNVKVILPDKDHSDLIKLLETRIRSERARAAAYKRLDDHSNAYFSKMEHERLVELKEAMVSGLQHLDAGNA